MSKWKSYGKIYRPDVCARPRLPHERVFTYGRAFTVRADSKKRVYADIGASARTSSPPRPRSVPPLYPLTRPAQTSVRTIEKKQNKIK
jgi:hypothetical protein